MKVDIAKKLLPFVNVKRYEESIGIYVEERLDILRKSLELATNMDDIFRIQGQIKEVKRLLTLRDEVTENVKRG